MASQESCGPSGGTPNHQSGRKLLQRAWDSLLGEGFAEAVARRYVSWMRDYVLFHDKRHPQEMGVPEVRAFLEDARFSGQTGERVEAAAAIRFLYEVVLQRHWPRGALEGPNENTANRSPGKPKAVYLNGRQPGVKLLDRVRNALACGSIRPGDGEDLRGLDQAIHPLPRMRHPEEMGALEVEQFLTHLAVERKVAKDTQRQALNALVFLYRTVLDRELGKIMPIRGRHGKRLPVVLTRREVPGVLQRVQGGGGMYKLMAELLYGSGLRIKECCRLRVKDVDLERLQLAVRSGKGDQDRATVLPRRLVDRLREQVERVRRLHEDDLALGFGRAWLPPALRRKYPNAERELGWQYLFPSSRLSVDPRERQERIRRRHHVHVDSAEGHSGGCQEVRIDEAGHTACLPAQLRHSFAGKRREHTPGAGVAGAQRYSDHDDLFACNGRGNHGRA
jgi:integrase